MSNCSNHKREVAGISDMKKLAEMIGDLHYEILDQLLYELHNKLWSDAAKDRKNDRPQLAKALTAAASLIGAADMEIRKAWEISKPFMEPENKKS